MNKMEITSLSSKGQIVIPSNIREKLKLSAGAKLLVLTDGENLLLKPIKGAEMSEFKDLIEKSKKN